MALPFSSSSRTPLLTALFFEQLHVVEYLSAQFSAEELGLSLPDKMGRTAEAFHSSPVKGS